MKKFLVFLIILAAFVGGLAAGEYWFGLKAEEAFNRILKELSDDKTILVRQHDFQRGLISSSATTVADTSSGNLRVNINNKLHHGPFPLEEFIAGRYDLNPVLVKIISRAEVVDKSSKSKKPVVINFVTTIDFNGNQSTTVNSPAGSHKATDGTLMKWQTLTGFIETDQSGTGVQGTFSLPKLTVESNKGSSTMGPLNVRYNFENNNLGLSLGKLSIDVVKLNVGGANESKPVNISKLRLAASTNVKRGLLSYSMGLKTDRINYDGESYGPGDFQLVIKGVDAKAVAALQKTATKGGKNDAGGPALMKLLGTFSKNKPEIETRLNVKTSDGEMKGRAKVSLKGNLGGAAANPLALLTALNAVGVITLPGKVVISAAAFQIRNELKAMVNSGKIPALDSEQEAQIVSQAVAGRITKWMSENWLVLKDKNLYQMGAKYEDGSFSFNGQPVNLLQGLMQGG